MIDRFSPKKESNSPKHPDQEDRQRGGRALPAVHPYGLAPVQPKVEKHWLSKMQEGAQPRTLPAVPVFLPPPVQKKELDEEALPVQQVHAAQRQADAADPLPEREEDTTGQPVQRKSPEEALPVQKKENNTGLPDHLKEGVENLSGFSMDDVRVHYNSDKPAQLQALAYAQGTHIHVGPGQEKHLPHEAWHVVQQKQGRVQATMQMKGVPVNDEKGLESEADHMGGQASNQGVLKMRGTGIGLPSSSLSSGDVAQCVFLLDGEEIKRYHDIPALESILRQCPFGQESAGTLISIVEEFISDTATVHDYTEKSLIDLLQEVITAQYGGNSSNPLANKIARQIREDEEIDVTAGFTGPRIDVKQPAAVRGGNKRALNQFLTANPRFQQTLTTAKNNDELRRINFSHNNAKKGGEGIYDYDGDRSITLLGTLSASSQEHFLQLLVHEMGHATFQNYLLTDRTQEITSQLTLKRASHASTIRKLQDPQVISQQNIFDQLMAIRNQQNAEITRLQNLLDENNRRIQDRQRFAQAYTVLKREDGRYFFGTHIGNLTPTSRRTYQASISDFNEFCAESFMHIALHFNAWSQYVNNLIHDPNTPEDVRLAWTEARDVLLRYRNISLGT